MNKRKLIFVFFIAFSASQIFANSIAFTCFQNKDADDLSEEISKKFELYLFEPFFDAGFIATNIPLAKIKSKKNIKISKIKKNLEELTDFALIIYMEYEKKAIYNAKLKRKIPDWKKLSVSLIEFSSEKEIFSKNFYPNKINEAEPEKKAQKLSKLISTEILNILNKKKGD